MEPGKSLKRGLWLIHPRYSACSGLDMICVLPNPVGPVQACRPTILVVEDDDSLRQSIEAFLVDGGYRVRTAASLHRGRELLATAQPAVCLLDLDLPDGSGLEMLREIMHESLPVKVIVMTAFPLRHQRARYRADVLIDWLGKPLVPGQLMEAVERGTRSA